MAGNITKKAITIAGAAVLTATMLLGGTLAWQAISPEALNENRALLNAGGRLHDDYNGSTKNVYVENFTEESGGGPIIVRVRLDEYMEIGASAGDKNTEESTTKTARPLVEGSTILNRNSWKTYKPWTTTDGRLTVNEESPFRTYIDLTFGSNDTIYYMPTFDKNVDSLASDVNGTYVGPDGDYEDADDAFKDYVNWTQIQSDGAKYSGLDSTIAETITVTEDDEGNTVVTQEKEAVYDADDDTADEGDEATTDDVTKEEEKHTLKPIDKSKSVVISMQQWTTEGSAYYLKTGDFWVYDEDGWAYWANLLAPGETTGLLLSENKSNGKEKENWYYGMNVVGEFVTASDLGKGEGTGFYTDPKKEPTTDAEILLSLLGAGDQIIGGVIDENGVLQLTSGNTKNLSINVAGSGAAEGETEISARWTVTDSKAVDGSDNAVIVLEDTGKGTAEIKAQAPGKATIVYIADGVTAAIKVNVNYAIYEITATNHTDAIADGVMKYSGTNNSTLTIEGEFQDGDVYYRVAVGANAFARDYTLTSVSFKEGIKRIGANAFYKCGKLTDVVLENGILSIEDCAFQNSGLTSINIPASVKSIGANIIRYTPCTEITIDSMNTNYCAFDNVIYNDEMTSLVLYPDARTDTSFNIPDGVTSISPGAFQGCHFLTSVTIPDSVTNIGACAFLCATGLKTISIPNSVTSIGQAAFSGTTSLNAIELQPDNLNYQVVEGVLYNMDRTILISYPGGKTGRVVIPDGVTEIVEYAISYMPDITDVEIPDSINTIREYAFFQCKPLENIYYAGTEEQWNEISISVTGNDYLKNATIHYNQQ